jgi:hypothetical protein
MQAYHKTGSGVVQRAAGVKDKRVEAVLRAEVLAAFQTVLRS